MNTADRSVEALIRIRRFFRSQKSCLIQNYLEEIQFNGFNLSEVLKTINERVEVLLDVIIITYWSLF
jgi:5-methylcytosine-specific restriction protein B